MIQKKIKFINLFPIILGLYFPLQIYLANYGVAAISGVLRPLIFSIAIAAIILASSYLLLRNWNKASIISLTLIIVFFTFGHLYDLLKPIKIGSLEIGRIRFLLPVLIVIAVVIIFLVMRSKKDLNVLNWFFTFVSFSLILFSAGRLLFMNISFSKMDNASTLIHSNSINEEPIVKRDVYYIILDKYTRDDYLLQNYGLDTSGFIAQLEDLGFYVARCSQPNYPGTALSMAASLNFEYLPELAPEIINENRSWSNFKPYIDHSRARQFFSELGYEFVSAETGYEWVEIKDADIYLRRNLVGGRFELTSFETIFLKTTLVRLLYGLPPSENQKIIVPYERSHYERILFTLDRAQKIPEIKGAKFTYLHLVVPHGPYVLPQMGGIGSARMKTLVIWIILDLSTIKLFLY